MFAQESMKVQVTFNDPKLPNSPGYHTVTAVADVNGKKIPFACGIFLPRAYFQPGDPMPVVMTLHNRGGSGFDGNGINGEGLAALMSRTDPDTRGTGQMPPYPIKVHNEARFIGLAPQCPPGTDWHVPPEPQILSELISQITRRYRADPDRVYLTGFSYGASSTWKVALAVPERFAAIIAVDGRATEQPATTPATLKKLGVYICVGSDDGEFVHEAERMRDAFVSYKHPNFVYKVISRGNHWGYSALYSDPDFWKWVFQQRRGGGQLVTTRPASRSATRRSIVATVATTQPGAATTGSSPAVLCQYFRDISGVTLQDLAAAKVSPNYPDTQFVIDRFEAPAFEADNFATVLSSHLSPPTTGDYVFYISGQDQCELWLSLDDQRTGLTQIAQVPVWSLPRDWGADPHQQSNPIHLEAGKSYFIEARAKHGEGDNHLAVAWRLPDGTLEGPIPCNRLKPAASVVVPPARVVGIDSVPQAAVGCSHLIAHVEYLGRRGDVPINLRQPTGYVAARPQPAVIYFPSGEVAQGSDGGGPWKAFSEHGICRAVPAWVLVCEPPVGGTWTRLWSQHATAAAIDAVLRTHSIDPQRVYLTGAGSGTLAIWSLPQLLPNRFAAVGAFLPVMGEDPQLATALNGTRVRIYTGVDDGMATDHANRMQDALATVYPADKHPLLDVLYEMDMGSEVAEVYYNRQSFYDWLFSWQRKPGDSSRWTGGATNTGHYNWTATALASFAGVAGASLLVAVIAAKRKTHRR